MSLYSDLVDRSILAFGEASGSWIETIDLHTAGEPLRVVLKGFPSTHGHTILEHRRDCLDRFDHLRTALMLEPRGHADMYGCLLVPPERPDSDFGVLFLHNEGYSTMCGHAIIALTTLIADRKWKTLPPGGSLSLRIDAPCGLIQSSWSEDSRQVSFLGVPSFMIGEEKQIEVENLGMVTYQISYGGAFYAYVDADRIGLDLTPGNASAIAAAGMAIKHMVVRTDEEIIHPFESDLSFLYGTIFTSKKTDHFDSLNVCIFADGELDRCPTGSGLSGRMAIEHYRNGLDIGETFSVESITGESYVASVEKTTSFGGIPAVIPKVSGRAFVTGEHRFYFDLDDPLKDGFKLG